MVQPIRMPIQPRRFYEIGGITVIVEADLPMSSQTFQPRCEQFRVARAGDDLMTIQHHFSLPDMQFQGLSSVAQPQTPWTIYYRDRTWIYLMNSYLPDGSLARRVAVFNQDHSRGEIFSDGEALFLQGNLPALTLFHTDQIVLARVLAERQGCILHSSGVILDGSGLLFIGQSGAGKSTMVKLLKGRAEILCDDRNILRRGSENIRVYGTWCHGEVPLVSSASAPLRAIFLLRKSESNRLTLLHNPQEILGGLLSCLVKPLVTADWWRKSLALIEIIVREIPCYSLEFDQSGAIVSLLADLVKGNLDPARGHTP